MRPHAGSRSRVTSTMSPSVSAPSTARPAATCTGVMPVSAIAMNRKLAPHTSPLSANCVATQPSRGAADARGAALDSVTSRR